MPMMSPKRSMLVVAALLGLAATPSLAQTPSLADMLACQPDAQRHCAGVEPGQGRMFQCLQRREADLSPACRRVVARGRSALEACAADVRRHCSDLPAGDGRVSPCLMQHRAALSPDCRATLDQHGVR